MGMKKPLGLTLNIINRNIAINFGEHKPRKRKQRMQQTATMEALEKWFEHSKHPAPSSRIAELMRELLEKNPELSFEQLHQLARTGDGKSVEPRDELYRSLRRFGLPRGVDRLGLV
jgi:hypothetical protein